MTVASGHAPAQRDDAAVVRHELLTERRHRLARAGLIQQAKSFMNTN